MYQQFNAYHIRWKKRNKKYKLAHLSLTFFFFCCCLPFLRFSCLCNRHKRLCCWKILAMEQLSSQIKLFIYPLYDIMAARKLLKNDVFWTRLTREWYLFFSFGICFYSLSFITLSTWNASKQFQGECVVAVACHFHFHFFFLRVNR